MQFPDGVGKRFSSFHRNQAAVLALLEVSGPRCVTVKNVAHDALALGHAQKPGAEAEKGTRRNFEFHLHPVAHRLHVDHLTLAALENSNHARGKIVWHVNDQVLKRLELLTVLVFTGDDLWSAHLNLVPFAAHGLEQDGEV